MHHRIAVRAGSAALITAALALALPSTASAHVTIRPDNDESGGWSKITVRVPNESDTAGTVRLQLDLPADTPFAHVSVQPHPGWTVEVSREQLAEPVTVGEYTLDEKVTSVVWTAQSGVRIGPGEFDEFAISVGPLPEPGTYAFPATQTYDDGDIVAWDTPAEEGTEEPEQPAPALTVVAATEDDTDDATSGAAGHHDKDDANDGKSDGDSSDNVARGVAAGGVLVGVGGLGIGAVTLRRSRA